MLVLIAFLPGFLAAQQILPGSSDLQAKWIQNSTYKMKWFMISDTARRELGEITTTIKKQDQTVIVSQQVKINGMPDPWVDSTVADLKSFAPIYHSSSNRQRSMQLQFKGPLVSGSYTDNMKKTTANISDTATGSFFDSNIYPNLLAWLPLKPGFKADIPVYNWNSVSEHGVVNVKVEDVKEQNYSLSNGQTIPVFVISVRDEISKSSSTYFIGKSDRKTYEIQTSAGPRRMLMQLVQ